jgi:flagellar motor component MotA
MAQDKPTKEEPSTGRTVGENAATIIGGCLLAPVAMAESMVRGGKDTGTARVHETLIKAGGALGDFVQKNPGKALLGAGAIASNTCHARDHLQKNKK